jgi:hypothetical protein
MLWCKLIRIFLFGFCKWKNRKKAEKIEEKNPQKYLL